MMTRSGLEMKVSGGEAVRSSAEARKQESCEARGWAWLLPQTPMWLRLMVAGLGVQRGALSQR